MSVSSIPGVTIVQNNTTPKRESAVLEDVMEFLRERGYDEYVAVTLWTATDSKNASARSRARFTQTGLCCSCGEQRSYGANLGTHLGKCKATEAYLRTIARRQRTSRADSVMALGVGDGSCEEDEFDDCEREEPLMTHAKRLSLAHSRPAYNRATSAPAPAARDRQSSYDSMIASRPGTPFMAHRPSNAAIPYYSDNLSTDPLLIHESDHLPAPSFAELPPHPSFSSMDAGPYQSYGSNHTDPFMDVHNAPLQSIEWRPSFDSVLTSGSMR